jgi:hypothetical protein
VCLALVRLRLQPCLNCRSAVLHMSPNPIADRALPFVAPAIERVYRNSQHLGQVSDRHESLAHIERHDCRASAFSGASPGQPLAVLRKWVHADQSVERSPLEGADVTMAQTVILGPYGWGSSTPLRAGESYNWALAVLTALPGGGQQPLRALTVTVVPSRDPTTQALGVTRTTVVAEPSGQLTVNFTVTNQHAVANCFGYTYYVVMVLP